MGHRKLDRAAGALHPLSPFGKYSGPGSAALVAAGPGAHSERSWVAAREAPGLPRRRGSSLGPGAVAAPGKSASCIAGPKAEPEAWRDIAAAVEAEAPRNPMASTAGSISREVTEAHQTAEGYLTENFPPLSQARDYLYEG